MDRWLQYQEPAGNCAAANRCLSIVWYLMGHNDCGRALAVLLENQGCPTTGWTSNGWLGFERGPFDTWERCPDQRSSIGHEEKAINWYQSGFKSQSRFPWRAHYRSRPRDTPSAVEYSVRMQKWSWSCHYSDYPFDGRSWRPLQPHRYRKQRCHDMLRYTKPPQDSVWRWLPSHCELQNVWQGWNRQEKIREPHELHKWDPPILNQAEDVQRPVCIPSTYRRI